MRFAMVELAFVHLGEAGQFASRSLHYLPGLLPEIQIEIWTIKFMFFRGEVRSQKRTEQIPF
jgi:hypothetical protein